MTKTTKLQSNRQVLSARSISAINSLVENWVVVVQYRKARMMWCGRHNVLTVSCSAVDCTGCSLLRMTSAKAAVEGAVDECGSSHGTETPRTRLTPTRHSLPVQRPSRSRSHHAHHLRIYEKTFLHTAETCERLFTQYSTHFATHLIISNKDIM